MRRMSETDLVIVDRALVALSVVRSELEEIDLRKYAADREIRDTVKDVLTCVKTGQKTLRHVKTLKWKRG